MKPFQRTKWWSRAFCLGLAVSTAYAADLKHTDFLDQYAATYRFRLGRPASLQGTPDGSHVYFLRSGPRSFERDLYRLDLKTGAESIVVSAADLLGGAREVLTPEEKARRERQRSAARGIASFKLSKDGSKLLVPLSGKLWVVSTDSGFAQKLPDEGGAAIDARFSPDATKVACIRNHDVYVIDLASNFQKRMTVKENEHVTYGESEFVAQEEMGRSKGYWWSPDSQQLLIQKTDTSKVETWRIADPLHPEKNVDAWPYPRPGKVNASVSLAIYSLTGVKPEPVEWDPSEFEYLAQVEWGKHGPLTLVLQDRMQHVSAVHTYDPAEKKLTRIHTEKDSAWVELHGGVPRWLPGRKRWLWISEKEGWKQLELRDTEGKLVRVLAGKTVHFDGLERLVDHERSAWIATRQSQPERKIWRVSLVDAEVPLEPVAIGEGVHYALGGEPSEIAFVLSYGPKGERRLRGFRGRADLEKLPKTIAELPPFIPNLEWTEQIVKAGSLPAVIVRPRNFSSAKRYPVLLSVYAGPGVAVVSKASDRYLLDQWVADQGFILVNIDGRGTPGRGRDWSRATDQELIQKPLEDQTEAITALCKRYPEMDGSRIGVFGWSFGGYFSAMATLRRPDVFQAGVAGAPVVSWEDYDTHYTERYLGTPQSNPLGYKSGNVLTYAKDLKRPLLLVHGTGDDNVYFMHSLKLAGELFKQGKTFDFLPLAGFTHMVPDPVVLKALWGRIVDHFQTHLGRAVTK